MLIKGDTAYEKEIDREDSYIGGVHDCYIRVCVFRIKIIQIRM